MSEKEKTAAQKLAESFAALPENKKEYLLGFADGVAAMKPAADERKEETA